MKDNNNTGFDFIAAFDRAIEENPFVEVSGRPCHIELPQTVPMEQTEDGKFIWRACEQLPDFEDEDLF